MFKNYCLVAIRNLLKYKSFSIINIAGLAIGMACCIMIFLYTQHELSYDRYHKNVDHIYRLAMNTENNGYGREDSGMAKIPGPWGPTALHNLPEVKQHPNILAVSASANMPGGSDYGIPSIPEGLSEGDPWDARHLVVDHDFLVTYDVQILQGRNFSKDISSDTGAYIINEAAAKKLGWENPLTKTIAMPVIGREPGPVIGVVKNFHFRSFRETVAPLMIYMQPPNWHSRFSIRIHPENISETLTFLEEKWHVFEPNHPFTYYFFDTHFDQIHRADQQTGKILAGFSGLAILIACLGLFGLASFSTQQRAKEIGIRKVLGASISRIILILSGDFLRLTLLANIIAAPIAYYLSSTWLDTFAYRINLGPAFFILTVLLTVFIATITVGTHAYKTARANPIDVLKSE